MTDRKAQHQARAQLVREGTRTLARATITDYRAASYETALKAEQERITREVHAARDAAARELLEGSQPVELSAPHAAPSYWTGEPAPLPKPDTKAGLLDRLNARHKN
jgi:hypothetical protein